MPARPFLAPVASMGDEVAWAVRVAAVLRGAGTDGDLSGVQLVSRLGEHPED